MKAKPRRPWIIGIGAVALGAILVAVQMLWWEGFNRDLFFAWLIFVVAPMCVVLGLYLATVYRDAVQRWKRAVYGALRFMPRKRYFIVVLLGFLCCLAAWARSRVVADDLRITVTPRCQVQFVQKVGMFGAILHTNAIAVFQMQPEYNRRAASGGCWNHALYYFRVTQIPSNSCSRSPVTFGYYPGKTSFLGSSITYCAIAHWVLSIPFALVLALGLRRGHQRFMRDPGEHYCSKCDYDLTGNVSGVCPECGTAVESSATANKSQLL